MSMETVKKTKAPARPKTTVKAQGDVTKGAVKAAPKTKTIDVEATSAPSYTEIAQLAERYWAERGYHDGQAEQDWLRAEQELAGAAS
jgi:hypothetical protein